MGLEIERKFLVEKPGLLPAPDRRLDLVQGYLSRRPEATVRVRVIDGTSAWLTVKSANRGAVRHEWEYEIPIGDALGMLEHCSVENLVEKERLVIGDGALKWEVDVFRGRLSGLVTAEIELPAEETPFSRPLWLGREVTGDPRYFNSNL